MSERDTSATRPYSINMLADSVEGDVPDGFQIHRYLAVVFETRKINVEGQVIFSDLLNILLGLDCACLQDYRVSTPILTYLRKNRSKTRLGDAHVFEDQAPKDLGLGD